MLALLSFVLATATAVVVTARSSKAWSVDEVPHPGKDYAACGQTKPSRVCDPEGYLGDAEGVHKALHALEADYEYPGCGAYEMGVIVISSIHDGGTDEATKVFAKDVMDKWGVGKAQCDNGFLLALAVKDRKMYIATGAGAQEHVPDDELQAVIERMKAPLRAQMYASAVEMAISDIAKILSGGSVKTPTWIVGAFVAGFVMVFLGIIVISDRRQRRYDECKRRLRQIERERAMAQRSQYAQETCPICLNAFSETAHLDQEVLVCGHTFHKDCIITWEQRSDMCPVCRCPTNEEETPVSRVPARQTRLLSSYNQEYQFRLGRARHFYPDYISSDMYNRWIIPSHSGNLVTDTAFIRSSPNYNSGSGGGSSSSFGGGCSRGGGGAGGGW